MGRDVPCGQAWVVILGAVQADHLVARVQKMCCSCDVSSVLAGIDVLAIASGVEGGFLAALGGTAFATPHSKASDL